MNVFERLSAAAVVPVVVLDDAKDAVATAEALLAGGVDVMEITFRTAAAADSIKAVAESCPDMLVGAGTVITLEQCKKAVECGAKFIVSPGFDEEVVRWCVENGVAVTPGCVTPTEIMAAMKMGLTVVKFFPAGEQDSLRDGFRHMENRGKPGCLQKKLFKTARYIHDACDKNIPDLGQRLPCPRARPDRPVSDRDVSLMTPRTKRSINRNEQCLRVAGMDVRNPVR